jgi:hypothetical protein
MIKIERRATLAAMFVLLIFSVNAKELSVPQKKLNSINCARVLAQRNVVETVYGVKIRFIEEVTNLSEGNFLGTTETKTGERSIRGIEFIEKYDQKNDIAQVTAVLKLSRISDIIDKEKFNLDKFPNLEIRRVAFASSSPENTKKLAALRAAEVEAYKNLFKQIGGFTLESNTKVKNFMLSSDKVKAQVIGAVMGAEYEGFAWEGKGEDAVAIVKLRLDLKRLAEMLGQKIVDYDKDSIEAEGRAAQGFATDDGNQPNPEDAVKKTVPKISEGNVDVMP